MSNWLRSGQALVEERLELGQMFRHEAGRGRRRRRAPCVTGALRFTSKLAQHPFKIGLDEAPGAHVLGLLLTPDDFRVLEAREFLQQRLEWEGIQLLDTQQVDVIDAALFALVVKIIVDLTRTDDDAADLFVFCERGLLALVRLSMIP